MATKTLKITYVTHIYVPYYIFMDNTVLDDRFLF